MSADKRSAGKPQPTGFAKGNEAYPEGTGWRIKKVLGEGKGPRYTVVMVKAKKD